MRGCYLTTTIAYKICLNILVIVAFVERNFSKLKLIMSYLRSSMSQERLNELVISIEKKYALKFYLIDNFASKTVRIIIFKL